MQQLCACAAGILSESSGWKSRPTHPRIHGAIQSFPCCSVNRGRTPQTDSANLQPDLVNEKRRYVSHVCRLFASELCGQLGPTGGRGGPFNCASWTLIQWINLEAARNTLCDSFSMFRVSYIIRDVVVHTYLRVETLCRFETDRVNTRFVTHYHGKRPFS